MKGQRRLDTKEERLAIADEIREFLNTAGQSRKVLVDQERHKLSESTVNKLFQGEFSERTLLMIESILGKSFGLKQNTDKADKAIGGYTLESVDAMQGDYVCIRPLFSNPTNLNAYLINLSWDKLRMQLRFVERSRADAKYTQQGIVYIPFGLPFMHLVSTDQGNIRSITLSQPDDDGLSRGIISTLSNPKGAVFIPVASPICLRRLRAKEAPELGIITPEQDCYLDYQKMIDSVTAEEFGVLVLSQNPAERRRGIAVVNS